MLQAALSPARAVGQCVSTLKFKPEVLTTTVYGIDFYSAVMQNSLKWRTDHHTRTARHLIALVRTLVE